MGEFKNHDDVICEGGPAFPVNLPGLGDNGWQGMTLRDWFAGQAMAALMQMDGIQFASRVKEHAEGAYAQADAMLSTRAISATSPEGRADG